MSLRLDAHQHFWHYRPEDFFWIGTGMEVLRRDFLPGELAPRLRAAGFAGSIAVQARPSLEETDWLLALAREHPWIWGVVGWVDLTAPEVAAVLAARAGPLLVGVRAMLQDEADDTCMLRADFRRGLAAVQEAGIAFDLLIRPRHLEHATRLVAELPGLRFVLDHLGKPPIREGESEPWAGRIRALARHPNVACKVSGMVTEADWRGWRMADFQPFFTTVLEAFGPERLLFGSDWPVCLLATPDHGKVVELTEALAAGLGREERQGLFGGNAARWYRIPAAGTP